MPTKNNNEKISTGFGVFDALWGGGLDRERLVGFLMAERGLRSAFAFQLAKQVSTESRVVLFSLELGREEGASTLVRLSEGESAFDDGDLQVADQLSILDAVFGGLPSMLSIRYGAGSLAEIGEAAANFDVIVVDGLERLVEAHGASPHPTCELKRIAKRSGTLVIVTADLDAGHARKGGPRYSDRADKAARFDCAVIPYVPAYAFEPASGKQRRGRKFRIVCEDRTTGKISFDGAIEYSEKDGKFLDVPGSVPMGKLWFALNCAPYREWCKVSQSGGDEREAARRAKAAISSQIAEEGMRPFLRSRRDGSDRDIAERLLAALLDFREEIEFPPGVAPCLGGYLELLKHDYPELVFVRTTPNVAEDSPRRVVFRPNYRLGRAEAAETLAAMEEKAAPIVKEALALGIDRRFEYLHDWIAEGVEFDSSHSDECREAYGPLLNGRGNEMGIVKAWHYLCNRSGLTAGATVGSYLGEQWPWSVCAFSGAVRSDSGVRRKWCHVDIAADTKISRGAARHDYFGLSDEELFADHDAPYEMMAKYRKPCPESLDYYGRKGVALFREIEVSDLLSEAIDDKIGRVEFQMPFRDDSDLRVLEEVRKAAEKASLCEVGGGWPAEVSHNARRMVFEVSIKGCSQG